VRTLALLLCLLFVSKRCAAQGAPAAPADEQKEKQYQQQKKSGALAVTLEALCPIAGLGVAYAGDPSKALVLAILSAVTGGAATGAAFELIHLNGQHPTGGDRAVLDVEQGASWTVLVIAGVVYVVSRISGLTLAPETTEAFNLDLRGRLGLPSNDRWDTPPQALAPGPMLTFRF
jgi:hypothetical protein